MPPAHEPTDPTAGLEPVKNSNGIVVVGSANMDQILRVERIPRPGETVLATGSSAALGGKGQNQAVAAARSGAPTTFIAAVGGDAFGREIVVGLMADTIETSLVRVVDCPSGTALIAVDDSGENTIIVDAGANRMLLDLGEGDRSAIAAARVLLLQLEISLDTVSEAVDAARASDTLVLLNAAPIRDLPDALLAALDILVVNEHEESQLSASRQGVALTDLVPLVVVTRGAEGAVLRRRGGPELRVSAPETIAVDTTGAGDTFCGAFAAAIARGDDLDSALRFAVCAASLSVERPGAVPSIPRLAEVTARLAELAPPAE